MRLNEENICLRGVVAQNRAGQLPDLMGKQLIMSDSKLLITPQLGIFI